jgi:DNA-directed RNA polymerase specialized sigma24 family protein
MEVAVETEDLEETAELLADGLTWTELLAAYREAPNPRAAEVLLEGLGPWLTNAKKALLEAPPFLDEEGITQQLVLEVLSSAARWEPHCEDHWIPRKLVEDAGSRVRKALKRERKHAPDELTETVEAPQTAEPELIFDTPIGKASAADVRLIYRVKVLGVPIKVLAARAGITPRQMRQRVHDARERARA